MNNSGRCGYQFDIQVAVKSQSLFFIRIYRTVGKFLNLLDTDYFLTAVFFVRHLLE